MDNVKSRVEKDGLVIELSGHIDSSNAEAVEAAINEARVKSKEGNFTLDAQNLEYISSAGLRVILRLSQVEPTLKMINVSSAVFEVLEMTGFSEMIPIEKAYRVLSIEGCEVIGQGANGKVYRIDADTIIKVYNNPDSLPDIKRERELARKAFVKGIPTAIPYDVVKVGNGYGSVFELLSAKSFSKLLMEDPSKIDDIVKMFVDLLKKIHSTNVEPGEMPDKRAVYLDYAHFLADYLPKDQADKLTALIEAVPDVHKMIHGDYHTKNVMLQKGEVLLIDMDTLSYGHPIFEFASMYLGFVGFGEADPSQAGQFLGIPYDLAKTFFHKCMAQYLGTSDEEKINEVVDKSRILGYARMLRRSIRRYGLDSVEGKPSISLCQKELAELLPRYQTLTF
jgi:uncharacterized protein (TIGR02172 family)